MSGPLVEPSWNGPDSFRSACKSILTASDEPSAEAAYHKLLYAVGNNHAGTYYPIALAIIPFAREILTNGKLLSQRVVLDVLIDLCGSFQPEPGFALFDGESLAGQLRQAVSQLAPLIVLLSQSTPALSPLTRQLLEIVTPEA